MASFTTVKTMSFSEYYDEVASSMDSVDDLNMPTLSIGVPAMIPLVRQRAFNPIANQAIDAEIEEKDTSEDFIIRTISFSEYGNETTPAPMAQQNEQEIDDDELGEIMSFSDFFAECVNDIDADSTTPASPPSLSQQRSSSFDPNQIIDFILEQEAEESAETIINQMAASMDLAIPPLFIAPFSFEPIAEQKEENNFMPMPILKQEDKNKNQARMALSFVPNSIESFECYTPYNNKESELAENIYSPEQQCSNIPFDYALCEHYGLPMSVDDKIHEQITAYYL